MKSLANGLDLEEEKKAACRAFCSFETLKLVDRPNLCCAETEFDALKL